jgi:hypothetical protein
MTLKAVLMISGYSGGFGFPAYGGSFLRSGLTAFSAVYLAAYSDG